MNTTGSVPTPVNGTIYTIGGTIGTGNVVINTEKTKMLLLLQVWHLTLGITSLFIRLIPHVLEHLFYATSPLIGNILTTGFSFAQLRQIQAPIYESVQTGLKLIWLNTGRTTSDMLITQQHTLLPPNTRRRYKPRCNSSYIKTIPESLGGWNNDGTFDSGTELVYSSSGVFSIATSFGFVVPLERLLEIID
jgi:hypothetical protein